MANAGNAYKVIKARFPALCAVCGGRIESGQPLHWKPGSKRTKHPECAEPIVIPVPADPDHGTFGQPLG